MKTTSLAVTATLLAAGVGHPAAACDPSEPNRSTPASVMVVPGELDLGRREPGTIVPAAVWLVNTGDEAVELLTARGTCGCTVLDFIPAVLAPRTAMKVPVRVTAPKKAGVRKTVTVTFTSRGHAPVKLPVRIATHGEPDALPVVRADPIDVNLGTVRAASVVSSRVRLVNTGDGPRRVTAARAGCSCITLPDFSPVTLAAGETLDVHLDIETPTAIGSTTREVTFVIEGQRVVKVPIVMQSTHPRVETLKQHLGELYTATCTWDGFRIDGDAITAIAWEHDGSRPRGRITCRFNDDGTVRSTVFETITAL